MRVAFLWSHSSGYFESCVETLLNRPDVEVFVSCLKPQASAPYRPHLLERARWVEWAAEPEMASLRQELDDFEPDVVCVSSWHVPAYRAIAKLRKGSSLRILCMDNPWRGSWKQYLGTATSAFYVRPLFDYAWVTGERQAQFACRLGFGTHEILHGLYAADVSRFDGLDPVLARPEAFIFTGRLAEAKGVRQLAAAYTDYRERASKPWPLVVAGSGPLAGVLQGPGVESRGFIQPEELPVLLNSGQIFVMPSLYEHWGVALHEAAAAGLPLVTTPAVGASVHLCQDRYNGRLVDPRYTRHFSAALLELSLSAPDRACFGLASRGLARQFTPKRWVDTLVGATREGNTL